MSHRDDQVTLLDIDRAAREAIGFVSGRTEVDFRSDLVVQSAVLYKILVIGEAVKRLSDQFRRSHDHIPWDDMAGARDRLIHGYDNIRIELVRSIVETHLPRLVQDLEPLIPRKG